MRLLGYVVAALAVTVAVVGCAVSYQALRRKDDRDVN
jgi:hypothetical protein